MKPLRSATLRARLTVWYVGVLAILLIVYAAMVFVFQYAAFTRQIFHDEVQDVVTVEGLLYFDPQGVLQLRQDYYSRPQSHLLVDRQMEVRDLSGTVLYRSPTLHGMALGGPLRPGEGDSSFDERIVRLADGSHSFIVSHIHTMEGRVLILRLGYSLAPLRERMMQFLLLLLIAIPAALAIAAAAGQIIARRALRPLEEMTAQAAGISASSLHDRLHVENPTDELGSLASVFNLLFQRLEQAFQQLQRFTADAAHELRTPLASIRTVGEVALERSTATDEYRDALGNILEETARLGETIDSLLLLARAEAVQSSSGQSDVDVASLIDEVLAVLGVLIEEHGINVVREGDPTEHLVICADRSLLRVALLNVLHNAIKFSPDNSTLRVSYKRLYGSPEFVRISIQDQGPGIPHGEHLRIFERFYTSNAKATASKSGTGLGLSVAKLIIERTGGSIRFEEDVPEGALSIIELPTQEYSLSSSEQPTSVVPR